MTTGFTWHEYYAWHDTGHAVISTRPGLFMQPEEHVESPESKRRFRDLLDVTGLLDQLTRVPARYATEDEIGRFHTPDYIKTIRELSAAGGGNAGESTWFGAGGYEIAKLSAGGVLASVEAVMAGTVRNAYALVRPPGHHAERDLGRGFCIFSNVALAAMHAKAEFGLERVAIVDFDVHHGNGTQQAFYDDPSVLFISLHQSRLFPRDSGRVEEVGEGRGRGANINIPLPMGSGWGAYFAAFERIVLPSLRAFRPQLILVSSGFDASSYDPLGRMALSSHTYRRFTKDLMTVADEVCDGRLVMAHEGGYSSAYVPFCGLAVLEQMSGITTACVDPFGDRIDAWDYQELQAHQGAAIIAVESAIRAAKPELLAVR